MVAIVLAGGNHHHSGPHSDQPLVLTSIAGQPFLYWLTQWLKLQGMDHIVFSAGHGLNAQKINDAVLHIASLEPQVNFDVVTEPRALGTAGAAAICVSRAPSKLTFIVNGNSILLADVRPIIEKFQKSSNLDGIILSVMKNNAGRFGALEVDAKNQLTGFYEKQPGTGLINAGVYLLKNELLQDIPGDKELSLERDLFPKWLEENKQFEVICVDAPFIDIGMPERIKRAQEKIQEHAAVILDQLARNPIEKAHNQTYSSP